MSGTDVKEIVATRTRQMYANFFISMVYRFFPLPILLLYVLESEEFLVIDLKKEIKW